MKPTGHLQSSIKPSDRVVIGVDAPWSPTAVALRIPEAGAPMVIHHGVVSPMHSVKQKILLIRLRRAVPHLISARVSEMFKAHVISTVDDYARIFGLSPSGFGPPALRVVDMQRSAARDRFTPARLVHGD